MGNWNTRRGFRIDRPRRILGGKSRGRRAMRPGSDLGPLVRNMVYRSVGPVFALDDHRRRAVSGTGSGPAIHRGPRGMYMPRGGAGISSSRAPWNIMVVRPMWAGIFTALGTPPGEGNIGDPLWGPSNS